MQRRNFLKALPAAILGVVKGPPQVSPEFVDTAFVDTAFGGDSSCILYYQNGIVCAISWTAGKTIINNVVNW